MKLRNKKTGEIKNVTMSYREGTAPIVVSEITRDDNGQSQGWPYHSLAELNEEWEDYEDEPYVIDMWEDNCICNVRFGAELGGIEQAKECGLYFETKEEAEEAVERLKAWKRLKDKGFEFHGWANNAEFLEDYQISGYMHFIICEGTIGDVKEELRLLFGGEE